MNEYDLPLSYKCQTCFGEGCLVGITGTLGDFVKGPLKRECDNCNGKGYIELEMLEIDNGN